MKIVRQCEALGARVEGLDLRKPLDEATVAALKKAWNEHLVLVFPDQDLTITDQAAFSKNFGELVEHPMTSHMPAPAKGARSEQREVNPVTHHSSTNYWHQDMSCLEVPFTYSLLYGKAPLEWPGKEDPQRSVHDDTLFCNLYKAYETLSPGLQEFLKTTRARHYTGLVSDTRAKGNFRQTSGEPTAQTPEEFGGGIPTEWYHPCARLHPETMRPTMYVNGGFVTNFEGWTVKESRPLINQLQKHAEQEGNVYRHHWKKGDLLCWDNRAVMHMGPPAHKFPKDAKRYMVRTMVTPKTELAPFITAPAASGSRL